MVVYEDGAWFLDWTRMCVDLEFWEAVGGSRAELGIWDDGECRLPFACRETCLNGTRKVEQRLELTIRPKIGTIFCDFHHWVFLR